MMNKSLIFQQQNHQHQQQQVVVVEENMSNLTSASNEGNSVSNSSGTFITPPTTTTSDTSIQPPSKKKRNLPGNPDPDAEVIALSPKSLLATNRFMCEICNKGFQRDQNLQLHRRGHNLPWKLKQRSSKEIRKKVYVCPEPSCVHHDPSRALGDLTGIKKHFCRKHGEKKWKCEKCSKKYAVQSDWKAHSKTCGTREYRCDCGTLFSRRDSFITHRAFCDALAQETARTTTNTSTTTIIPQLQFNNPQIFPLKKEPLQLQSFNLVRTELPPWLGSSNTPNPSQNNHQGQDFLNLHENENPNPNPNPSRLVGLGVGGPTVEGYQPCAASSAHMSATALLQKAAQMGATMSSSTNSIGPHHQSHVSVNPSETLNHFPLNLSSRDHHHHHNHITTTTTNTTTTAAPSSSSSYDVMMMNSFSSGFEAAQFDDPFGGILVSNNNNNNNTKKDDDDHGGHDNDNNGDNNSFLLHDTLPKATSTTAANGGRGGGGGKEELTRDFLGLRPLSHSDILSIAAMGNCMNNDQQNQAQKHW
ncbi:hypothetical protein PIB30_064486 [Stylosanthes scabra]|uniref:C2H2-type domain-containing protein n=1 Tax=Stylosanthes scabra TaxID=79078 RepID=A0ABU6SLT2_9FABA|nr:hypothetical protein [Stylosanthes scabra]